MPGLGRSLSLGAGASRPAAGDLASNISAGGLTSRTSSGGRIRVRSSGERQSLIDRLSATFGTTALDLEGLRDQVRPGFSEFRRAGLAELDTRRDRSVSNLRENLARRRVSGSSFANDSLARAEAEFAQEAVAFSASATLQELDAFAQLSTAIGSLRSQEVQTFVDELNLQADVALALQGALAQAISASSLQQQRNAGAFTGKLQDAATEVAGAAAGALAACWVARAVYGAENPEWLNFRDRMFRNAPAWFIRFYLRRGAAIAAVIERAPVLKKVLRPIMDRAWR